MERANAKSFRDKAAKCRAKAERTTIADAAVAWLSMARSYDIIAAAAELRAQSAWASA